MPDAREMSGIPRPVDDLPAGAVSVRLIRGDLSNNIANHPVELHRGTRVETVPTDDGGRAQFSNLTPGEPLKAVAVVDGERLESQEFPAPAEGGIRLMLVATDKEKAAREAAEAAAPAVEGEVIITGQSRFFIEPGDETATVYYLLDLENRAKTPVNPPSLFMFDTPAASTGTSVLEGSSPRASVTETRVRIQGPFPPGRTAVRIGFRMPIVRGTLEISQVFPAAVEQVAIVVRKLGPTKLESPHLSAQQEFEGEGEIFIAGTGSGVAAGQPVSMTLSGLPHHSPVPRIISLSLAGAIIVVGVWAAGKPPDKARETERRRLVARRDRLFADLVRLEADHRSGRGDERRYAQRREELLAALENVYGALDTDDTAPGESAPRAGLGASLDVLGAPEAARRA